jgi:hypothetical protein
LSRGAAPGDAQVDRVFPAVRVVLALALGAFSSGCEARPDLTPPTELCTPDGPRAPCRSAAQVEQLLRDPALAIEGYRLASGRQLARQLTLVAPSGAEPVRFRAKWRAQATAHALNDPRKEVAAHALQKLFLEPDDWVLPPSVGYCFELGHYRSLVQPQALATFADTDCVFGTLSYWLEQARGIADARKLGLLRGQSLHDREAFARVPSFRRTLADTNLLAHLASNGDTHPGQFVLTGTRQRPQVHLVDYTISLADYRNPSITWRDEWSTLHVPALRERSIARLRALRFEQLEQLIVIEEYEARAGRLFPTPPGAPIRRDIGLRWNGARLQLGLTETEIHYVWGRLQELLARVERGEIRTFQD